MPEGKRVTLTVKASEAEAAAIDAARGTESRSAWLLGAARLRLAEPSPEVFHGMAGHVAEPVRKVAERAMIGYPKSRQLGGRK